MPKTCTKCLVKRDLAAFAKDAKRRDGLQLWCRECFGIWRAANRERLLVEKKRHYRNDPQPYKDRALARRLADPEGKKAGDKAWRLANLARKAATDRAWYGQNKERKAAYDEAYRAIYYTKDVVKAARSAGTARRRCRLMAALPKWVDLDELKRVYEERQRIEDETGLPHDVDHIVPLAGKTVCGLHVPWNLRIVPRLENLSKGNKLIEHLVYA